MLSLSFTAVEFSSHFYVLFLFEDFDLAMKWPLEIDVCICLNHLNFKLPLTSLSAGSSRLNYMYRAQKTQIFLCSMLVSCRLIYLSHLSQSTKFTIFITTHDDFDGANPSSMQDACQLWTQLKVTLLSISSHRSVGRAPTQFSGRHGFDSCWGLRFFFVPCSCHVD